MASRRSKAAAQPKDTPPPAAVPAGFNVHPWEDGSRISGTVLRPMRVRHSDRGGAGRHLNPGDRVTVTRGRADRWAATGKFRADTDG